MMSQVHQLLKNPRQHFEEGPAVAITNQMISDYVNCQYKAHLSALGEIGYQSDYQELMDQKEKSYITDSTNFHLRQHAINKITHSNPITEVDLIYGAEFIIDVHLVTTTLDIIIHGLKRVTGDSLLGYFYYEPMVLSSIDGARNKFQEILLSIACHALEEIQHVRPLYGSIVSGGFLHKAHRINLSKVRDEADKIVEDLEDLIAGDTKPPLRLNEHCRVCRYQNLCLQKAKQTDDLSLLRRMTDREIRSYNRKGISTVGQLSHTFRFRKRGKRVKAVERPHSFPLQALAIREKSVFIVSKPAVPKASTLIYIDMEGNSSANQIYLVGMLIVENGKSQFQHIWSDCESDDGELLDKLYYFLNGFANSHIFYYGNYEAKVLKRLCNTRKLGTANDLLTSRSTNILKMIYANVYFPTYSNELKEIASYLGFQWTTPNATGLQSIIWREKWLCSRDAGAKDLLITYNKDDCLALRSVSEFLSNVSDSDGTSDPTVSGVQFVEQIKNNEYVGKFGKTPSIIEGYAEITERAYFDYQRDKVYLKTNKNLKNILLRKKRNLKSKSSLRRNKTVTLRAFVCPKCKGRDIRRDPFNYHAKDSLDLRVSRSGIKRWVIHYRTAFHFCNVCNKAFVPLSFKNKPKYGHGLMSWAMDQHIGNRITLENLEKTVRDYFSLPIRYTAFHKIKANASAYYAKTYDNIFRKLLRGNIIHVDETKIDLQKGSGYIWVFTNMEEVFYLYRDGREAEFLHTKLSGFEGVLISDFYTGYDSLPCRQQKCLLHLIRDINEDLLKYPFDQELKDLAFRFGALLRSLIGLVDRVGLKRIHLQKRKGEVQSLIKMLEDTKFGSDASERYSKRILKYRDKLFLFMDFDGVPWNNNNAEHAIKPFAKYRRLVNGRVTENGLKVYLVLLSIYQTCKYKEIPFLDFMLSGERDIDRYAENLTEKELGEIGGS
jgi:predicted RecB family nuclease